MKSSLVLVTLIISSVLFLLPFIWLMRTAFTHEAGLFPQGGEPMPWYPLTSVEDGEGRSMVQFQGGTASILSVNDAGRYTLLFEGEEVQAWFDDIQPLLRMGLHLPNFTRAFEMMDFWLNLRNTLFICFATVIGTVLSSSFVAYSFARISWRGREPMFLLVLATMMVPYTVTLIPLFALFSAIGWTGTFKPLIVPYWFGVPFYIFLLRQFFRGIPEDLSAAARIDGCTEFGIYWRVVLPLAKPALATTALFMFLFQWGDFLNPLIYLQDDRQYTLAVALQQFQSQHESAWGPLMAMAMVITMPIVVLFFFTQRTFIQGIAMTGLKG